MVKISRFTKIAILVVIGFAIYGIFPMMISDELRSKLPSYLQHNPITLGLDLKGGAYLLLEIDDTSLIKDNLNLLSEDIRSKLKSAGYNFDDEIVSNDSLSYTFSLASNNNSLDEMLKVMSSYRLDYEVSFDNNRLIFSPNDSLKKSYISRTLDQTIGIIRTRLDETGTKEPIIQAQGLKRIMVQLPGLDNTERIKALIGKTAKLTFHLVSESNDTSSQDPTHFLASSYATLEGTNEPEYKVLVSRRVYLSGEHLIDASPTIGQNGQPVVTFKFDAFGSRTFARLTQDNINKRIAVLLDNKVLSAPVVRSAILGGSGIIEGGNMQVEEATDLALLMRAGALPVSLIIVEERSVGAGLGLDSIASGIIASIIGGILVAAYIILVYRLWGVFAVFSLSVNLLLIVSIMRFIDATLTMPGIAGIVLTMGMAVDANVLIYERIREEARIKSNTLEIISEGFNRALATILDANFTTLFAGIILFSLGSGPIRGFAVTLTIGIITSMFSALMLNRWIISAWLLRKKQPKAAILPI